jgi:hypothetical protein
MTSDDEFRRAGDELDRLSRAHQPASGDAPAPRGRWLAVAAAGVLVLGAVAAIAVNQSSDGPATGATDRTGTVSATGSTATPATAPPTTVTPTTDSAATTTTQPTTTNSSSVDQYCIAGLPTTPSSALVPSIVRDPVCGPGNSFDLSVTNPGTTTCTSDQVGYFGDQKMRFVSQSGIGGAIGYWEPMPVNTVDATGVIDYPPGARSWPVHAPSDWKNIDGQHFSLSISCAGDTKVVSISVAFAPGFPHGTGDISISSRFDNVNYYGACGNEVLTHDAITMYPLLRAQLAALDTSKYPVPGTVHSLKEPAVAPPGPGDAVGTLVIYSDGIATFQSQSGRVIWLTNDPQSYGWVC